MGYLIRQTVDLSKPDNIERAIGSVAYSGDALAHTWEVTVEGNATTWLTGKTATMLFVLPSRTKVMQSATISGNVVSAQLEAAAYAEVGTVVAFMQITDTDSDEIVTIAVMRYIVNDCASGEIHIPEDIVIPAKELTEKYVELKEQFSGLANLPAAKLQAIADAISVDTVNDVVDMTGNLVLVDGVTQMSANEKVIGKWIDGRKIYRRTYKVRSITDASTMQYYWVSTGGNNLDWAAADSTTSHALNGYNSNWLILSVFGRNSTSDGRTFFIPTYFMGAYNSIQVTPNGNFAFYNSGLAHYVNTYITVTYVKAS